MGGCPSCFTGGSNYEDNAEAFQALELRWGELCNKKASSEFNDIERRWRKLRRRLTSDSSDTLSLSSALSIDFAIDKSPRRSSYKCSSRASQRLNNEDLAFYLLEEKLRKLRGSSMTSKTEVAKVTKKKVWKADTAVWIALERRLSKLSQSF